MDKEASRATMVLSQALKGMDFVSDEMFDILEQSAPTLYLEIVQSRMQHPAPNTRIQTISRLGRADENAALVLPYVLDMLADPEIRVRAAAVEALCRLHLTEGSIVDSVRQACQQSQLRGPAQVLLWRLTGDLWDPEIQDIISQVLAETDKIKAIKDLRNVTALALLDCKNFVEAVFAKRREA